LFGQDGGEAVAEGEGAGRLVEGGGAVGHHRPPAPRGGVRGAGGGKFKHQTPKSKEISNTKPQGKKRKAGILLRLATGGQASKWVRLGWFESHVTGAKTCVTDCLCGTYTGWWGGKWVRFVKKDKSDE